ncbi:hypothetical protein EHF33_20770 (plasmid) [Deinococcus psychrotolerans]|uniref:Uncharacterized protein n=1 Tax=Deinococcus psychrotolerans TaxID=2489213 RepID=A0A3G8YVZ9_9DEIO|nr:hypothetical protein [Deinococcus psychrotolerans]AZI45346.1 hypothetical protein EHF33_20770 [Deinococcus psychrotolerans]
MPKLLELDRTFQIAMPANANGGWVDLKWDSSWRVAALLAGGADRGKIEIVSGFGRFAALDSAAGAGYKPLLAAGPVLADVLPGAGLPYLTITVTPTYGVGVRDPGVTTIYRGRPHETSPGVWDLTDIGYDSSGPVLVPQQTRQNIDDALGSLTGKLSQADADHLLTAQSLADTAQAETLRNANVATAIGNANAAAALLLDPAALITTLSGIPLVSIVNETSTFSGWGGLSYLVTGTVTSLKIYVRPFDAAALPTQVHLTIARGTRLGSVDADFTVNLPALTAGVTTPVIINLPAGITLSNERLYVMARYNGKAAQPNAGVLHDHTPAGTKAAYTIGSSLTGTITESASTLDVAFDLYNDSTVRNASPTLKTAIAGTDAGVAGTALAGFAFTPSFAPIGLSDRANNLSTFSGWASNIGIRAAHNAVQIYVNPWDVANPIKNVRYQERQATSTGTVLVDVAVPVGLTPGGGYQLVTIPLGLTVNEAGTLWAGIWTDGRTGYDSIVGGTVAGQYTTGGSLTGAWSPTSNLNLNVITGMVGTAKAAIPAPSAERNVNALLDAGLNIPYKLWAVMGKELNVYLDAIKVVPTGLASLYNVDTIGVPGSGALYADRYTITPASATTYGIGFRLMHGKRETDYANVVVQTVAANSGNGVTRKLLVMSDSNTDYGYWLDSLLSLCDANPSNTQITLMGTRPGLYTSGSPRAARIKSEGVAGRTLDWHYQDPAAPFTFNGTDPNGTVFSLSQYLTSSSQTMSANDYFMVLLGTNDVFAANTDAAVLAQAAAMKVQLDAVIANVKAAVSGIRVIIGEILPPAASQDAFGFSYGNGQTRDRYHRNRAVLLLKLREWYGANTGNVYYVPFGSGADTVNNWGTTSVPRNAYDSTSIPQQQNGVHVSASGAIMPASSLWHFMAANA